MCAAAWWRRASGHAMLVASTRRGHVRLRMRAARELTGQRRVGAVARVIGVKLGGRGHEVGVGADIQYKCVVSVIIILCYYYYY